MNDAEFKRWLEAAQSGRLTLRELQQLARQHGWPPAQCDVLRQEILLSRMVADLPQVPVSTNFTHRVMEALERERAVSRRGWRDWWQRYWPRIAVPAAAAAAVAIYFGAHQYQMAAQRAQMAASVHAVATLVAAPAAAPEGVDWEVWENFDVIMRMGSLASDNDLLRMINQAAKP